MKKSQEKVLAKEILLISPLWKNDFLLGDVDLDNFEILSQAVCLP